MVGTVGTAGTVGISGAQAEESEPETSQEGEPSLEASETEFDERKQTFEYLNQRRRQKRLNDRLECLRQAREETRAEVERILEEDAERSREAEKTMNEEAAAENADVGIAYVEDETGKLVKQRASAQRKAPARRRVPPALTAEDRERIGRNTDRHTRSWYNKTLEAVIEGRLIMTKEQYHALTVLGRSKGWNRRPRANG
jgi:hypothetical protein